MLKKAIKLDKRMSTTITRFFPFQLLGFYLSTFVDLLKNQLSRFVIWLLNEFFPIQQTFALKNWLKRVNMNRPLLRLLFHSVSVLRKENYHEKIQVARDSLLL